MVEKDIIGRTCYSIHKNAKETQNKWKMLIKGKILYYYLFRQI